MKEEPTGKDGNPTGSLNFSSKVKSIFLAVLSGTEVVEGGPVSISNSQQTAFSQFHSRGLFLKDLAALVSFPAPL